MAQTGQSDAIHSPEACAKTVVRLTTMWRRRLRYGADRPVGRNPFPGGMRQDGGEVDDTGVLIDRGGLHGRDLMLA
jgi:hypothetical protein